MKRTRLAPLLVGVLLLAACVRSTPSKPIPAPAFDLQALAGGRVSLSSFKGKVVVLDFWATWCGPCMIEIPEYIQLWHKNQGRGVEIVAVACESDPQEVRDLALKEKMPYHVLISDGHVQDAYGASGLPTTYVIDKDGQIRKTFVGTTSAKFEMLQKTIDEVLAAS